MADSAKWYVVHTYSGYENTVKATIEKHVENRNMHDLIDEVKIPLETVTEITDNGPKVVERKVFPGYVLVKMIMTDGDTVKITDGALESFLGAVEEIDLDRSKVRVVVSMFGRETPVELELDQVEPVQS